MSTGCLPGAGHGRAACHVQCHVHDIVGPGVGGLPITVAITVVAQPCEYRYYVQLNLTFKKAQILSVVQSFLSILQR